MHKRWRTLVFFLFVGAFFVIAPAIVLRTAGLVFIWPRLEFVRTAALEVQSEPSGAEIILEGKRTGKQTPATIKRLRPGTILVELRLEDAHAWNASVELKAGETQFIPTARLWSNADPVLMLPGDFSRLAVSPDGAHAAFVSETDAWSEIWIVHDRQAPTLLYRLPSSRATTLSLTWSTDAEWLAFENTTPEPMRLLLRADGKQSHDVLETFPRAENFWWDPNAGHVGYLREPTRLVAMDPDVPLRATSVLNRPVRLGVLRDRDWIVLLPERNALILAAYDADTSRRDLQTLPTDAYELIASGSDLLRLRSDRRLVRVLEDRRIEITEVEQETIQPPPRSELPLLLSDAFSIQSLDLQTGSRETWTRVSRPITQTLWHPSGDVALVCDAQGLVVLERDVKHGRVSTPILQDQTIRGLWLDSRGGNVYLLGTINGRTGVFTKKLIP